MCHEFAKKPDEAAETNPKLDPNPPTNTQKDRKNGFLAATR
jgi:hypothetical protein